MDYGYQSEKLSSARHSLMLPHPKGVETSIASAFFECTLAFHDLDVSGLSDSAREWVAKINELMDTSGVDDPKDEGTHVAKGRSLSTDQQFELSRVIDELASYFHREFWSK